VFAPRSSATYLLYYKNNPIPFLLLSVYKLDEYEPIKRWRRRMLAARCVLLAMISS
jgi:hypothetical protein